MNIGDLIKQKLKEQGRSQKWLAGHLGIDEKTFSGKLIRNSITAEEIIKIGNILEINLNKLGRIIMDNSNIVYAVINEGEVVYASFDEEYANNYAENKMINASDDVLDDLGNDDPSEKDILEAGFIAGYEGGYYEVHKLNLSKYESGDDIELPDGTEISYDEIISVLDKDEDDFNLFE